MTSSRSCPSCQRPTFPSRAVITAGMPYGNKDLHFGHIGGVFVPADYFARFLRDRIGAENVLFVSGTDCYGSPIAESFRKQSLNDAPYTTIEEYVRSNHDTQKRALDAYNISLDIYEGSGLGLCKEFHTQLSHACMERLYEQGYLLNRETMQFYDTKAETFLNGRQVHGRCPIRGCKSEHAYADECDLGHQFDPEELIAPISQLTNTVPELRPTHNWYFDLPHAESCIQKLVNQWEHDEQIRTIVVKTVRESLAAPVLYIKNEFREKIDVLYDKLGACTLHEADTAKNQQSFSLEFSDWRARDKARAILEEASIRFRGGKCLLPLRITGDISWGVPAPSIENLTDLTIWCWPESLWAPISFSQAALAYDMKRPKDEQRYTVHDWQAWWCTNTHGAPDHAEEMNAHGAPDHAEEMNVHSTQDHAEEANTHDAQDRKGETNQIFQFIGQDNIYFYCVAQPGIWDNLGWNLKQTTPVANYHLLFMNKKASSSSSIKPPSAYELLDYYTAEQLRCHWLSLALDTKVASFMPKPYNTSLSYRDKKTGDEVLVKDDPRVADPVLKESAFLTNIFNRLARSCFYGAARACQSHLPDVMPADEVVHLCRDATLAYERAMHALKFHVALSGVEEFTRQANKRWDSAVKSAKDDDEAYKAALADAFCALRTTTLLMHAATPAGCELIAEKLNFDVETFFSWEHAFATPFELAAHKGKHASEHVIEELPPRFDFFKQHERQLKS